MDRVAIAHELADMLQHMRNVLHALRGTTLLFDTSQPGAYDELIGCLRTNDLIKALRMDEEEGRFEYMNMPFQLRRDGSITYIEAITK